MVTKHLLIGSVLTGALAFGANANAMLGIQIDPNGAGNIAGSTLIDEVSGGAGHFLCRDCAAPAAGGVSPAIYMMESYIENIPGFGDVRISYQLNIPVVTSDPATADLQIDNVSDDIENGNGSIFNIYLDTANTGVNDFLGTGFDNGVLIASGFARIGGNTNNIRMEDSGATPVDLDGPGTSTVDTITIFQTSINIDVNITSQNNAFVTNDLVNADLIDFLDVGLFAGGLDAPYLFPIPGIDAASAFDGAAFGGTYLANPGLVNDFAGSVLGTEDFQTQVSSVMRFNGDPVPEPATTALIGLGLGLAGMAGRRRKQKQAA